MEITIVPRACDPMHCKSSLCVQASQIGAMLNVLSSDIAKELVVFSLFILMESHVSLELRGGVSSIMGGAIVTIQLEA